MIRCASVLLSILLLGAAGAQRLSGPHCLPSGAASSQNTVFSSHRLAVPGVRAAGSLPLSFESNEGQTNAKVRFLTHTADSALFFTPSEAVFTMATPIQRQMKEKSALLKGRKAPKPPAKLARTALRMQMIGSNPRAAAWTQQPLPGRINYFIGSDPSRWHAGVPTFGRVGFHEVYPGVDLLYYGSQRRLEYDFVVAPHADPRKIQLHFAGAQRVRLSAAGDLIVRTQGREMKWRKPTVYQQNAAGRQRVAGRFRLKTLPNGQADVGFALGRYDTGRTLVIDPVLIYSTYLGGNGVASADLPGGEDFANAVAVDRGGNAYVTGLTVSLDFPITSGAYQTINRNQYTVFVTKLNPSGTALVYSTFLGGGYQDTPGGLAIDSGGNAYITGYTSSLDFPTTPGAFQPKGSNGNSIDSFVTKLNPTGTALIYSTYLGSPSYYGDTTANGIVVDGSGNAFVVGGTAALDFPVTAGAFQTVLKHSGTPRYNVFVTKFNPAGSALVYSTYLGGTRGGDEGASVAIDGSGNAYVVGSASSSDFPVTPGAFQTKNVGSDLSDGGVGFATKLNPAGTALIYSTYLGGSGQIPFGGDSPRSIAVDSNGSAYIAGGTVSKDFPATPGAFQAHYIPRPGYSQGVAFVTKLNPAGSALVYSTYLEGTGGELETSLRLQPHVAAAETRLGRLRLQQGRPLDAIALLTGASEDDPYSALPLYSLARAYAQVGKQQESQHALAKAETVEKYSERVTFLEDRVQRQPENLDAHRELTTLFAQGGERDKAQREADMVHVLETHHPEAVKGLNDLNAATSVSPPARPQ